MKTSGVILSITVFVILTSLELSFVSSLPWPLSVAPLVFAASVYFVQHRGLLLNAWWLPAYGLLLDILGTGRAPYATVAFGASALVISYLSRAHLSNRSLYGVLACGASGYAVFAGIQALALFLSTFFTAAQPDWSAWATASLWQFLWAGVILFAFFQTSFSRR